MHICDFFKILSIEEVVSFGQAQRNRQIDWSHVNEFYTIIKNTEFKKDDDGTYLVYGIIPIIWNPLTNHILDAVHRVEGAKKAYANGLLDKNARFVVGLWPIENEDEENEVIVMLNTHSKNWTLNDYINSYAQYNENYQRLKDFCETHMLCRREPKTAKGKVQYKYRYPAAMITGKGNQGTLASGAFSFTDEQFAEAHKVHEELVAIRKKLNLPMVGTDIENMACEWYVQRNFISVSEIKALTYIPKAIQDKKNIRNKKDWADVFRTLKDCIQKVNLKNSAA